MEKFEVSKEFILEAHKAACCDWKSKLEMEFPEAFKTKFDKNKIYIYKSGSDFYKLSRIERGYVWADLTNSISWANGNYDTPQEALASVFDERVFEFNRFSDFAKWLSKHP